jgi:DNA-binding NarL/FixJ family response regulator
MIVSDFTVPELDRFREQCNFVGNEIEVFELRSQGIPLEQIAENLNMSVQGIKKVSRKVNNKITAITKQFSEH